MQYEVYAVRRSTTLGQEIADRGNTGMPLTALPGEGFRKGVTLA